MEVVWVVSAGNVAVAPGIRLQAPPVYLYRTASLTSSVVLPLFWPPTTSRRMRPNEGTITKRLNDELNSWNTTTKKNTYTQDIG